ncbi:MAG: bifunctional DNA-formamidopyrimidine glycosylase/DNA-(apurinic or apyrimidinic site) lyase [Alphaproteobacteria bacterium]|nr:bifunctional DNA-formamidopyrimidine glycosylase/DNA-(apurinic or apyrimidinic site) lyase [Alphaproteobacteria bacterium]
MPELPEVETTCQALALYLKGQSIKKVDVYHNQLRSFLPEKFQLSLKDKEIIDVTRKAKYIVIRLSHGLIWICHLGMSGSFALRTQLQKPLKHDHIVVTTTQGTKIAYNDPRRFGMMDLIYENQLMDYPLFKKLGPEPLDKKFNGKILEQIISKKTGSIKSVLLDQTVVSGLGNIYVCESLFDAGILPQRIASTIKNNEAQKLALSIQKVLKKAIKAGGSSLKDYKKINGELGYFQHQWAVYGKEGKACVKCKSKIGIMKIIQAGRSTYYCQKCQK